MGFEDLEYNCFLMDSSLTSQATSPESEELKPALDDLQERSLDIRREIQSLADGSTKVTAERILVKLNDLLDAFTPEKMDSMPGKNLMSAIKESVETINLLIGKKDASQSIIVNIVSSSEKPPMVGVITQTPN